MNFLLVVFDGRLKFFLFCLEVVVSLLCFFEYLDLLFDYGVELVDISLFLFVDAGL